MRDTLYDPHSVVDLEIIPPSKYFLQAAPLTGGGRTFGYLVKVKLNAKNRMGGYVGRKTMNLLIRDGRVVKSWEEGEVLINSKAQQPLQSPASRRTALFPMIKPLNPQPRVLPLAAVALILVRSRRSA